MRDWAAAKRRRQQRQRQRQDQPHRCRAWVTPISKTGSTGAPDGAAALEGTWPRRKLIALHYGGKYDGFRLVFGVGGRGRRRRQGGSDFEQ